MWKLRISKVLLIVGLGMVALAALGASCSSEQTKVYHANLNFREKLFLKAQALYPMPIPQDFPLRKDLVEFTHAQAGPGPWYVYIQTDSGSYSSYYVARSKPQNACNFLSETKTIRNTVVVDAPSLDGIYYGGTGASGACDAWFWFDASTGALVESRFKFTISNQPLAIEVPEIRVRIKK